eukprot:PITA_35081
MKGCREFFSDLEEKYLHVHIKLGDDRRYSVIRIGIITFKRESESPLHLKYVMFILGLKKNFISISILEDRGYDVIFSKGKAFMRHIATWQVKQIDVRVKNLYKLDLEDFDALRDVCKGCTLGKYVKSTFHDWDRNENAALERVFSDVCGPFSIASTVRHKFYVIFTDDLSKKCWIFFMRKKDETFSKIVEFKELVEKETRKKVKPLKSDNGGDYVSNDFKEFCAKEGIQRELTTPHNPQHNRVVERIKTLWEL